MSIGLFYMKIRQGMHAWYQAGISIVCALAIVACSDAAPTEAPVIACDNAKLGVERTITVTVDTGSIETLLNDREVVLTFDDGPDPRRTLPVLDQLDLQCTKATFFLLGEQADRHPDIIREIGRRGHSMGGHSWSHANLTTLTTEAAHGEVSTGMDAVNAALSGTGATTIMFRFPFVATNAELSADVREMGLLEVGVTADGADWTKNRPEASVEMILQKLGLAGRKGVILLHDPFDRSDERVSLLLSRLKQDGYKVVALGSAETGQ
jgi:peptidoglycan-N-acetylglucosamine deacetylase